MTRIRFLLLLAGLLVLLILPTSLILADNGPHGSYTATTDACAGCHRAHTAPAAKLLVDDVPNLCFSCHGTSGTGADTNVEDGVYLERDGNAESPAEGTVNRGLKAGGFVNTMMATNWPTATVTGPITTTSSHTVNGSLGTVWGWSNTGPITPTLNLGATNFSLSCVSCHDPHGGADAGAPTYRILRATVPITGAVSTVVTDEIPDKLYTISDNLPYKSGDQYFAEGYTNAGGNPYVELHSPEKELTPWCSQCHTRYQAQASAGTGPGRQDYGDAVYHYRHLSDGYPSDCTFCHTFAPWGLKPGVKRGDAWNHYLGCMTCHVAHGSSAQMVGYADGGTQPGNTTAADSALLRVDNRGVCQLCHGK